MGPVHFYIEGQLYFQIIQKNTSRLIHGILVFFTKNNIHLNHPKSRMRNSTGVRQLGQTDILWAHPGQ